MVENGKFVQIEYTGSFDNGEIFDTNIGMDPLEFQIGSGTIINGLDQALLGMAHDEEKDIIILPEDGYGDYNEDFVLTVPLSEMRANFEPEPGMVISIQMENGNLVPARVTDISDDNVILDLNHPLAGKTLHFKVKVVGINDDAQLDPGCASCSDDSCGDGGCSC